MAEKLKVLVFIFLPLHFLLSSIVYEVPVEYIEYSIESVAGFDRVVMSGSFSPSAPGHPDLPALTYNYLLPRGERLKDVVIIEAAWHELPGDFYLYPRQQDRLLFEDGDFIEPDPEVYGMGGVYPRDVVVGIHSGSMRGYQIGQVALVPFRYFPRTGRLEVLTRLVLRLETEVCGVGVYPRRQTRLVQGMVDRLLSDMVVNRWSIDDGAVCPSCYLEENPLDGLPTELPSLLGAPVDFLIVTTDVQVVQYEEYARLRKLSGYNTAVRTMSWVREHYGGVDDAERVRNFIRDAVEHWGVLYVLLGGDVPEVPTRWVWMNPLYNQWPVHIVTDVYYSDLDGNWNFDADERFGEIEDSLDLYPDVYVGRLPTHNSIEVLSCKDKIDAYLYPVNSDDLGEVLFFTSDMGENNDAYDMAKRLAEHLPAWLDTSYLNERPRDEFEDSINAGFGVITGIGHGDINNMRVRNNPRENATNFFFDSLSNTGRYAVMFVITCFTNPFQSDCLSEHWIVNAQGGGVGYIGPTSNSDAYVHEQFTAEHFDRLFSYPLGQSLAESKVPFIPGAQLGTNWYRLYQFSINLLGDPALDVWDSIPLLYDSVVVSPETITVGIDTVAIRVYPSGGFDVVFYKEGEIFLKDSSGTGVLEREVKTESAGYLKYRVKSDGYVGYVDSVVVEPGDAYCVYRRHTVLDTAGNDDGVVNPGEDIWLQVMVKNTGGAVATDVDGQLVCSDGWVTMVRDTASYSDIAPGDSSESLTSFYCVVSDSLTDGHSFDFELVLDYGGLTSRDSFQVVGAAPVLEHYGQAYSVVADTVTIVPYLVNHGQARAAGVYGRLSVYSDTVVVVDSMVVFPVIDTGGVVSSASDSFKVYCAYSGALVRYNFRVYDRGLEVINRAVLLDTPAVIDSLLVYGRRSSVVLEWSKVVGAAGYRVYRALAYGGPYVFMGNHLEAVCYFEDVGVESGQDYYYYVVVVDSFRNEGGSSDTVLGRVNPLLAVGWPQPVSDYCFASPNFGDLDTLYGGYEVVVCDKGGYVYAWHCDGTPVSGDGVLFSVLPDAIWSSPALGDVDGDGSLEVVFGVRRSANSLYVIDAQGSVLSGWPQSVGSILGSPVLADIDEDGDLEIFVWNDAAALYAFHHDGTGVYAPGGLLEDLPGAGWGTPAIGDINGDGDLEIVCCGGSGSDSLYVWDKHGNYLTPFPVYIQDQGLRYSVVLGDVLGDDALEISFYADNTEGVYVVTAEGTIEWFQGLSSITDVEASPIIADITGDGCPEIICGYPTGFSVFDSLGYTLDGFPDTTHDMNLPVVADVDNNNSDVEALVGSAEWNLYAYRKDGRWAPGFPVPFSNRLESSPALYDIDNDGKLELMVSSFDYAFYVFDLETEWTEWPRFRYDPYNSGVYKGFAPEAPYVTQANKSGNNVAFTWNKITADSLGNPELMDHYVVYRSNSPSFIPGAMDSIGVVMHPETTYTDTGALNAKESCYYLVKAVDWAQNQSKKSNMGYVFRKSLNNNPGTVSDRNWMSLPYMSEYDSINDLTDDLSPTGNPISKITRLDAETQNYYSWVYHPVLGWYGNDPVHVNFPIVSGVGYETIVKADSTVVIVGINNPDGLVSLNENTGASSDRNWVAIPYNAVYDSVKDITDELSPAGRPVSKITRLDEGTQLYYSWIYHPVLGWYGNDPTHENFPIELGTGYEFIATIDTTWNPVEYSNGLTSVRRARMTMRRSDIEIYPGESHEPLRAPVWTEKQGVYVPLTAGVDKIVHRGLGTVSNERAAKRADHDDVVENSSALRQITDRKIDQTDEFNNPKISHIVHCELVLDGYEGLIFTVYRPHSPFDVLTEKSAGCVIARCGSYHVLSFDVGNFQYPWSDEEELILIIEAVRDGRGYCEVRDVILDGGVDIQELVPVELEAIPEPRMERGAVRWCGMQSEHVIGYSVYRGGERLNGSVVRDGYRVEGEVVVRPVIRGGYETVYGSSEEGQSMVDAHIPISYAFQLYPNPFVTQTHIEYAVPRQTEVEITVYDVSGREVKTLVSGVHESGYYAVNWKGTDERGRSVSSGIYFVRFETDQYWVQDKILLVR